jgi:hypothetical protein
MSLATILRGHDEQPAGRHAWPKDHPVDDHGRKRIADPVEAGYRLTPAAYQTYTRTTGHVPATGLDDTGLLDAAAIRSTNQWTVPAAPGARTAVMAEMRADLDATTAPTEVIPAITGGQPDPAEAAVDQIFTDVMSTETAR